MRVSLRTPGWPRRWRVPGCPRRAGRDGRDSRRLQMSGREVRCTARLAARADEMQSDSGKSEQQRPDQNRVPFGELGERRGQRKGGADQRAADEAVRAAQAPGPLARRSIQNARGRIGRAGRMQVRRRRDFPRALFRRPRRGVRCPATAGRPGALPRDRARIGRGGNRRSTFLAVKHGWIQRRSRGRWRECCSGPGIAVTARLVNIVPDRAHFKPAGDTPPCPFGNTAGGRDVSDASATVPGATAPASGSAHFRCDGRLADG